MRLYVSRPSLIGFRITFVLLQLNYNLKAHQKDISERYQIQIETFQSHLNSLQPSGKVIFVKVPELQSQWRKAGTVK